MAVSSFLLLALLLPMLRVERAGAQPPLSVKDVMRRVGAYVDSYGEKASIVVATEDYRQELRGDGVDTRQTRRIVADFAIVKVAALDAWWGFRDVVEVDGVMVQDRDDRLVRLLRQSAGEYDEARRLSDESARFNIGGIQRNFNVPTTAMFFFRSENQDRFKFTAKEVDRDGTWHIAFRETSRPTLIRTPAGEPVMSKGSIWVNPANGTVLRTVLEVEGFVRGRRGKTSGSGRIDVRYHLVTDLGMWLPDWMDEEFNATRSGQSETITGRAQYSNYRQFTTSGRIK